MFISASVGKNGKNYINDVKRVQELLNIVARIDLNFDTLSVDGKVGNKTYKGIAQFQRDYVKLGKPDSRIDKNGRTEKFLVAQAKSVNASLLKEIEKRYPITKQPPKVEQLSNAPKVINYRKEARRVVSEYSTNIVKLAMSIAGVQRCDFSSTLRTFDDQTRIMFNNCSAYPNAKSVSALRTARGWGYAAAGRSVEEIYYAKKAEGTEATKTAMKAKIIALYEEGKKVSLHCVPKTDYTKRNVIDIPYSSVAAQKRKELELALMGMSRDIKNARYAKPTQGEIYIDRLIVENQCWHIEILQTMKPLPNMNKTLHPRHSGRRVSNTPDFFQSYLCFLDNWY